MRSIYALSVAGAATFAAPLAAQQAPPAMNPRMHQIVAAVSAERIERDITKLVSFGSRHSFSDTLSTTRGIGAARRWIFSEFEKISADCGGCLEVMYISGTIPPVRSIPDSMHVVNVVAIQRGTSDPNRMVVMSGDIDAIRSGGRGWGEADSVPGANDNASGMAGTIEAARVLSQHRFAGSIVYLGLSAEEQGLHGGRRVAAVATEEGWNIIGVLNNDMIGNIEGISGTTENVTARVFSETTPPSEAPWQAMRTGGGEVDGQSRQLARYVDKMADMYLPTLDVMMIYRLDRFGRGGHHRPFNDAGYAGVRIMETNENYNRQHQDIRDENGIHYGDVLEKVNFAYAAKLTALNAVTLGSLAAAPGRPAGVRITGANSPAAILLWDAPEDEANVVGYKVYWRATDSPTWDYSQWVGVPTAWDGRDAVEAQTRRMAERFNRPMPQFPAYGHRFTGLVIDNYYFGVATVAADGSESTVVFPMPGQR